MRSLTFVPGRDSNHLHTNQNISKPPLYETELISMDTSLIDPLEISAMAIVGDWQREERRVGVVTVSELSVAATSVFLSDLEMYFPN